MKTISEKYIKLLELDKILSLLADHACSSDAKILASQVRPLTNLSDVAVEMQKTTDAYTLSIRYGNPPLQPLTNIIPIVKRSQIGSRLSNADLLNIAHTLHSIWSIFSWKKNSENTTSTLDELFVSLIPIRPLEHKIFNNILSETEIADDASPELFSIRQRMKNCSSKIRETLDNLIRSPIYQKSLQEPIITMRDGRYVVPVKLESRSEIKGLVHDSSISGATLFVEPIGVVDANNEMKVLQGKEQQEIDKILDAFSLQVSENADVLFNNYHTIMLIDLYFAKATLACNMKASTPKINDNGKTILHKARHPLIPADKIVPIDINLGVSFDTLVITGPNTGGKTVALKTLGLLTLMAMSGLMIPAADNSEISVFDNVLADIGDEQSIEQNLSTFSSHMKNIISIVQNADSKTLVLVDELGAGTDPTEGAALAIAILEDLKSKGAKVASTTHYSEIKIFALQTPGVENACCEFDVETLKPTYKLLIGIPGKSNAFAISNKLGLDNLIIERAKHLISTENLQFEDVISDLEKTKTSLQHEKDNIIKLKRDIEIEKSKIQKDLDQLTKDKESEIAKARSEAKQIVEKVKSESKILIDELNAAIDAKNTDDFSQLAMQVKSKFKSKLRYLDDISDPITKKVSSSNVPTRPIKTGDSIIIVDINQRATAISDQDSSGYVRVQAGILKTKVHTSNIRLLADSNNSKPRTTITKNVKSKSEGKIESEIHLRGMTVEEALEELDRFIDNAMLMGLSTIRIVHGKGTGTLRTAVTTFLRRSKYIDSFRLGLYGEGEDGVTIATIKR